MKTISYNSSVAALCGKNGIIKAVLINYIYNYHKPNIRKGAGQPAAISLPEFVYQYSHKETSLWGRSFIHRILKDLIKDGHVTMTRENSMPVYAVSSDVAALLNDRNAGIVSFDLGEACKNGIYAAIISRYLLYVIDQSPEGQAYNLKVDKMAEINRISPAQIYRAIKQLIDSKVLKRVKSRLRYRSRALSLARCYPPRKNS